MFSEIKLWSKGSGKIVLEWVCNEGEIEFLHENRIMKTLFLHYSAWYYSTIQECVWFSVYLPIEFRIMHCN